MYNEEKKLITDIQRKKDLDRNLALFAGVASKANYEYPERNVVFMMLVHSGDIPS